MAENYQSETGQPDEIEIANRKAFTIGLIGGILLLVAGVTGVAAWEQIQSWVFGFLPRNIVIAGAFAVLIFIAALGGLIVMVGSFFLLKEKIFAGKFFIFMGVGVGLIGFLIGLIVSIGTISIFSFLNVGMGFIGIVLSIVARRKAKKREPRRA